MGKAFFIKCHVVTMPNSFSKWSKKKCCENLMLQFVTSLNMAKMWPNIQKITIIIAVFQQFRTPKNPILCTQFFTTTYASIINSKIVLDI